MEKQSSRPRNNISQGQKTPRSSSTLTNQDELQLRHFARCSWDFAKRPQRQLSLCICFCWFELKVPKQGSRYPLNGVVPSFYKSLFCMFGIALHQPLALHREAFQLHCIWFCRCTKQWLYINKISLKNPLAWCLSQAHAEYGRRHIRHLCWVDTEMVPLWIFVSWQSFKELQLKETFITQPQHSDGLWDRTLHGIFEKKSRLSKKPGTKQGFLALFSLRFFTGKWMFGLSMAPACSIHLSIRPLAASFFSLAMTLAVLSLAASTQVFLASWRWVHR